MGDRHLDSFIVPMNLGNASRGKGLHINNLSEDTLSVLRNGGNNGNEIGKNNRNIGIIAKTRVYVFVLSVKC